MLRKPLFPSTTTTPSTGKALTLKHSQLQRLRFLPVLYLSPPCREERWQRETQEKLTLLFAALSTSFSDNLLVIFRSAAIGIG